MPCNSQSTDWIKTVVDGTKAVAVAAATKGSFRDGWRISSAGSRASRALGESKGLFFMSGLNCPRLLSGFLSLSLSLSLSLAERVTIIHVPREGIGPGFSANHEPPWSSLRSFSRRRQSDFYSSRPIMGLFIFLSNRISTESPTVRFSLGKHRLPIKPLHWDRFDPFPTFNFDDLATFFNLSFCQLAGIRNRIGIQNSYDNGRFIIKAFQNDLIRRVLLH